MQPQHDLPADQPLPGSEEPSIRRRNQPVTQVGWLDDEMEYLIIFVQYHKLIGATAFQKTKLLPAKEKGRAC